MLDWLGDIGGLFDALRLMALYLIAPISTYALKQKLMAHTFVIEEKQDSSKSQFFHCLCCSQKRTKYHAEMRKASRVVVKELDLVKFIEQRRMATLSILALLQPA